MKYEGPSLQTLLHRLQHTPPDFLAEPRFQDKGTIVVRAVVADLFRAISGNPFHKTAGTPFATSSGKERNRLRIILIATWVFYDVWFRKPEWLNLIHHALAEGVRPFSQQVDADQCVNDPDRREEFVRLLLNLLELRPEGETIAQAQDRFQTLDTLEQQRVLAASRAAEERAQKIRAEIKQRLEEEEAAAKAWRE